MHLPSLSRRPLPVAVVVTLAALGASCTGGDSGEGSTPTSSVATTGTAVTTTTSEEPLFGFEFNDGDGRLVFGGLLVDPDAETGPGASAQAAARIAIDEINDAGGVLGEEAFFVPGEAGIDDINRTQQTVDRLLNETTDVFIDGTPADQSLELLTKTGDAGVMQFSPVHDDIRLSGTNGSPLYFRSSPAATEEATVVADLLTEQSLPTATVLFVDTELGMAMTDAFTRQFESLGGEVVQQLPFPADSTDFGSVVDIAAQRSPNAVVVIGGEELLTLFPAMDEFGIGPRATQVYALTTTAIDLGSQSPDPGTLNGLVVVEPAIDPSETVVFAEQLAARGVTTPDVTVAVATYDAIIIAALATEIAGTDRPTAVAEQIIGVTRDGVQCVKFDECKELVQAGDDINYDSLLGGPYEFVPPGEPSAASFRVSTYDGATTPNAELDRYVFAR